MKKFCTQNIRRAKTDKIDSVKIAVFGITYWNELAEAYSSAVTYDELRFMARQYYQTTSMIVKAKVNLSNLLDQVMPEIQNILVDQPCNHKLTEFVNKYIHFQNILDMGERKFTTDYCKWAEKKGYRCNERKCIIPSQQPHLHGNLDAAARKQTQLHGSRRITPLIDALNINSMQTQKSKCFFAFMQGVLILKAKHYAIKIS